MTIRLHREVEQLKKKLLSLSAQVEENVHIAVQAVMERDSNAAEALIESDQEIDQMEVDLEEDCLKVLALHQPVAHDLRYIIAFLKINSDLERIGDLAVNIAKRVRYLATHSPVEIPFDLYGMADKAKTMLRRSLDALVSLDESLAKEVCQSDEEVDDIKRTTYPKVYEQMRNDPSLVESYIQILGIVRHIERIADHAARISEDVVYLIEGEIVRHNAKAARETEIKETDAGSMPKP